VSTATRTFMAFAALTLSLGSVPADAQGYHADRSAAMRYHLFSSRAVGAALIAILASCASYGPGRVRVGQSADEVAQAMGQPTGRYALAGGAERLEYARGPYGLHTYMIDLDAAGRVTGWAQVLDDAHFAQIAPGQSRDDVLPRLGHPSDTRYIGWQKLVVWAYRYDTPMCQWFQVSFDTHWSVADVSYGPDPRCEAGDRKEHARLTRGMAPR
jgi:hypothetical protein